MIDEELFKEFLDNRAQLDKNKGVRINTKRAILILRNKLTEFENEGHNLDNIMNKSMEMGWKSVFRPKDIEPKQQHLTAPKAIKEPLKALISSTRIPRPDPAKQQYADKVRTEGAAYLKAKQRLQELTGAK